MSQGAFAATAGPLQVPDVFQLLPSEQHMVTSKGGYRLRHVRGDKLSEAEAEWALQLTEKHMRPLQEQVWGWDASEKEAELRHVRIYANSILGAAPVRQGEHPLPALLVLPKTNCC